MISYIWIASIVVAICCLSKEEWHYKARCYLFWALFPFYFIFHPKLFGYVKSWSLFLVSPFMLTVYFFALGFIVVFGMFQTEYGIPSEIPYHSADDLKRISGVEFPEVIPVDSSYIDDYNYFDTSIKFVPVWPLQSEFFQRLEKACISDSCCWRKEDQGYRYLIYPERPIDRTKGTHIRKVEENGEMINDWDADFVEVYIPFKGDTIYVKEGWFR